MLKIPQISKQHVKKERGSYKAGLRECKKWVWWEKLRGGGRHIARVMDMVWCPGGGGYGHGLRGLG